jgi:hypothetical protein
VIFILFQIVGADVASTVHDANHLDAIGYGI